MTSRNPKCSETTGRKRVLRVLLVAVSVVGLFSSPTSGASAKFVAAPNKVLQNKPLVASQIYFGDQSLCTSNVFSFRSARCPSSENYYQSIWAVSITNPNKSAEARSVRARVILLDASGNEVVNKVMQVTARLAPGQTTWLAPELSYGKVNLTEGGSGIAISGTVTILPHKWGARSNLRTVIVPLDFSTQSYCWGSDDVDCWKLAFKGSFPNPGKSYSGYRTTIFFGDNGAPLAGIRLGQLKTIAQGGNSIDDKFYLNSVFASKIADVQLFVSR